MRLEITCTDRLGICQDVLTILKEDEIDLRGIEVDPIGKIYLSFPSLEFSQFQTLMPKIRRIPNVSDVKTIPYLPFEREHFEFDLLLSTLPNPVISVDDKGRIDITNSAAEALLGADKASLKNADVRDMVQGLPQRWLEKSPTEPQQEPLKIGGQWFLSQLLPVWVKDADGEPAFAGAVIHGQAEPMLTERQAGVTKSPFDQVLTQHSGVKRVIRDAMRMAQLDAPLLIEGETGVGKELIAKACHQSSSRWEEPFLAVNCGALPDNVAEGELFGYGAGIFSHHPEGKKGIFEQANGGTVLLDSVGDMSRELQAKLLRFLENGEFRRIGEEQVVEVNVRLICLARGELLERVEQGAFREDLYYRLNVLSLYLPPLRERKGDVGLLAEHFLYRFCQQLQRPLAKLSKRCADYLNQYHWPGNVRQLENSLYRAVSMLEGNILEPHHIRLPEASAAEDSLAISLEDESLETAVKRFEASLLKRLYPSYPSTRQLAQKLGLSHTAIANKLRDYGIGKQRKTKS
ncbi:MULTISPECIES: transcriptional regulator TyrR [Gammaproteobacteria]|uniref:transcriptional regulator TyrR n=1 Tax=Gammaproteobacteria TaxID=1236 RepID=UPI000DCFDA99|nr:MULTISPECIES: transcriptional regulator TyrR [Gammaproteobacteria]RTE87144.1 transcriptional regulator TyrR [Aliidiomarina sp. B3213]TCZ93068.1 transcriptional regulator TyrR [Lysobacter sp. N42]